MAWWYRVGRKPWLGAYADSLGGDVSDLHRKNVDLQTIGMLSLNTISILESGQ